MMSYGLMEQVFDQLCASGGIGGDEQVFVWL